MKKIELTKGKFAIVDDCDYYWISKFSWYAQKVTHKTKTVYYASRCSGNGKKQLLMHRILLGLHEGDSHQVDHINGNGIDNRRVNLRMSTRSQNAHNRSKFAGKSKYVGVCWSNHNKMWMATLSCKGHKRRYFYSHSEIECAKKRDEWAIELHKEFAFLNFPKKK